MELYHGSPNKFTEFDYSRIRTNGSSEGVGFYFTSNKKIAEGYGEGGYLYTVELKGKKPLDDNKKTLTKEELRVIIEELHRDYNYLSNYGEVDYEGYEKVLRRAVENEYDSCDTDTEILGSLYNTLGENENVIKKFYTVLGYDYVVSKPSWGEQELYIALTNDVITIKKVEKL